MKLRLGHLLAVPPLLFLGVFYFYPMVSILLLSLAPEGALDVTGFVRLVRNDHWAGVLWFTVWQAALSTVLTLVLALPAAYVFARYEFRGRSLIQSLTAVPFVLPTVVTAAAFMALLGPGGVANTTLMALFDLETPPIRLDRTVWFFLMAHVFYNFTVVLRIVGGFWSGLPRDLADAARMLGATGLRIFCHVTLPLLLPAILAASLLVFIFCFTSFGVVLILGGPRLATLEVEIYTQAVHLFNLPMAAVLSLVQLGFTFALMAVYTGLERRTAVSLMPETHAKSRSRARNAKDRWLIGAATAFFVLLLGTPLLALVIRSLITENGISLAYYLALFQSHAQSILYVSPVTALVNSLGFALAATGIALFLGVCCAAFLADGTHKGAPLFDPVFMLPLSTSAVTLGYGFVVALDEPPLNLRTSLLLPAAAHAMVAFPLVIRSLLPALRSIPRSLREAAAVLGAPPFRVWRTVDLPIIARAMSVGAVFAFAISMGEFGATVFVARPQTPTLPLAIYRYLSHPGAMNYGQAMAMSCLLMLTTAAGFVLLDKTHPISGNV